MTSHPLGKTGLRVSDLGFGAGSIGDDSFSEEAASMLLNTAVDLGITLIDTARGYGLSEARIGRYLAHRRHDIVLSTKVGYGVPGYDDWTPECITAGVERALRQLATDYLDIVFLHSCDLDTLRRPGLIDALTACVEAGKIRCAGYSGENEALDWAVASGAFDVIECSSSLCDQRSMAHPLPMARARGMGIIAKRPLANAFWRFPERPEGDYCLTYWERAVVMQLSDYGMAWDELALRFLITTGAADSIIAGTRSLDHLKRNAALMEGGALPADIYYDIRRRFVAAGGGWQGEI